MRKLALRRDKSFVDVTSQHSPSILSDVPDDVPEKIWNGLAPWERSLAKIIKEAKEEAEK